MKQVLSGNEPMVAVKEEYSKHLVVERSEEYAQKDFDGLRAGKELRAWPQTAGDQCLGF